MEKVKAGSYDLTAEKEKFKFTTLKNERISSNHVHISNIEVSAVSVCGSLSVTHPPPNFKQGSPREVKFEGKDSKSQPATTDKDGKFCTYLAAGTYTVSPVVSSTEQTAGLVFSPPSLSLDVAYSPIQDITFSQLRVTVSGRVVCLTMPCDPSVSITLQPASTQSPASSTATTTSLDITDSQFFLRDILPGSYRVVVNTPNDIWCWKTQSHDLVILKDTTNIEFVQSGYGLPITADRDVEVHIQRGKDDKSIHKLTKGTATRICLEKPGNYELTTHSCFKFDQDSFSFDTSAPRAIDLKASRIKIAPIFNQLYLVDIHLMG